VVVADEQAVNSELVDRLDRIADLVALTLVRGLEQDEQIRLLSAAGYTPSKIGAFLGIRPNTVSVARTRARQKKATKPKAKPRRRQSGD
jgi:DNA-binding CsgD family transcriptional regulator